MKRGIIAFLLVFVLCISIYATEVTVWNRVIAHPATETNTGNVNSMPYNNPSAVMDLEAGTWVRPAVMDYDGDGYWDIVAGGTGIGYSGTYVFYGDKDSTESLLMSKADKVAGQKKYLFATYLYDSIEGEGKYTYAYQNTVLFYSTYAYPDFKNTQYTNGVSHGADVQWPYAQTRENAQSLADYDGDGVYDLIRAVDSWTEYGELTGNAYTADGTWGDGDDPLHGYVMWAKNFGTNEAPMYATTGTLICVNGDVNTPIDTYGGAHPNFYDFDGDGDLDLLCNNFVDDILYYQNVGSATAPVYAEGVPVLQVELCMPSTTVFDWDGDGDFDLLIGEEDGRIGYYANTGAFAENGSPVFASCRYFQTPADTVSVGILNTPFSIDWDADGDEDLFSGDSAGFFNYVQNLSIEEGRSLTDPSWAPPVRLTDENGDVIRILAGREGSVQGPSEEKWGYTVISMGDWDGDGDADILANSIWGKIVWLENRGSDAADPTLDFSAPQRVEVDDPAPEKPLWNWWDPEPYELVTQWRTTPYMIDLPTEDTDGDGKLDGDGLMDIVMLDSHGYLAFYERFTDESGTRKLKPPQHIFLDESGNSFRLTSNTKGSSGRIKLLLTDWDGDGDLDVVRNGNYTVRWFENVGDGATPYKFTDYVCLYEERDIAQHSTCPTVCDWNQDGVPDLIIGAEDGHFYYFTNRTEQYDPSTKEDVNAHLVAHWDFVGETPEEQLADKAAIASQTASTTADNLTAVGGVTVQDGIATLDASAGTYLNAGNLADVNQAGPMTVFMRVKLVGDTITDTFIGLADKRAFKTGDDVKNRAYAFGIWKDWGVTGIVGTTQNRTGTSFPANLWRELAFVVDKNTDGRITVTPYLSNGPYTDSSSDFAALTKKTTSLTSLSTASIGDLLLGRNPDKIASGVEVVFDDIRIYNTALTATEMASILESPISLAPDTLSIDGVNLLPAFTAEKTAYTARVAEGVETVTVRASAGQAVVLTVNGTALTDGAIALPLAIGENPITVRCALQEESTCYNEYTVTITRESAGTDLTGTLVGKWNFEGTTLAEQLADKGDNGSSTPLSTYDGIHEINGVCIEKGMAVYKAGTISYLAAEGTDELSITGDLTLIARVKLDGITPGHGIIDHRNLSDPSVRPYAMYQGYNVSDRSRFGIGGQISNTTSHTKKVATNMHSSAKLGEWVTLAMVVRNVGGKMTMYLYASTCENPTSGADFALLHTPQAISPGTLEATDYPLYIGNNPSMTTLYDTMYIDEARIYNVALTMEQLGALQMHVKDAAALETLIDYAESLSERDYTEDSYADMLAALSVAKAAQGAEITDVYYMLADAVDSMVSVYPSVVTPAVLADLVSAAKAETEETLGETRYVLVQKRIAEAEALLQATASPLPEPPALREVYLSLRFALETLPGDINGDRTVTVADALILIRVIVNSQTVENGDINGDGKVGLIDVIRVMKLVTK